MHYKKHKPQMSIIEFQKNTIPRISAEKNCSKCVIPKVSSAANANARSIII